MSNPSLIWAQLSIPNPPVGSVPFVYIDAATIITDVLNLKYTQVGDVLLGTSSFLPYQLTVAAGLRLAYQDTTNVPGNAVINTIAGRFKIAAGQTAATISSTSCFASSIIDARIEGSYDATAIRAQVTSQTAGSFIVTLNAAATNDVVISFIVNNVF